MRDTRRYHKNFAKPIIVIISCFLIAALACLYFFVFDTSFMRDEDYKEAFLLYMGKIEESKFDEMYAMLNDRSKGEIEREKFISRNENIYGGIEASDIQIDVISIEKEDASMDKEATGCRKISYRIGFNTCAGSLSFDNTATVYGYKKGRRATYLLDWGSYMIYPSMKETDKIRVSIVKGNRGAIYDRNGEMLAGTGIVKNVGFVPGKMNEEPTEDIEKVAQILGLTVESISDKLSAKWVREDLFVPLKSLRETDVEKKELLLAIPGILINDVKDRVYPFAGQAAHLTGYIQSINKEELDARAGQNYNANSKIGKIGLESLLEDRIRGIDGGKISITDENGNEKEIILQRAERDGEDVTLTIDMALQSRLYDQLKDDKSSTAVINYKTGEVLALLSTPGYDPNEFILGLSQTLWQEWNTNEARPLYNRFKAAYCPGSSLKPIIAAIGLTSGRLTAAENLGPSVRSWQKDSSWGTYHVTTLKEYGSEAVLKNALVYSDNVYFAKAALKIGEETLKQGFQAVGFMQQMPFTFGLTASTYGKEGEFQSEIEMASSGFGQGRMLVNPLHMASIYSAFLNEGNMISPKLLIEEVDGAFYLENVFTVDAANTVRAYLVEIVENKNGTAHAIKTSGLTIGGKTGTAEIKDAQEDEQGTELGWLAAFAQEKELLFTCMIEDVKGRGGSHYVFPVAQSVFNP